MKTKSLFFLASLFFLFSCQKGDELSQEDRYMVYATIGHTTSNMTTTILNPPIEVSYELNGVDWYYKDVESIDIDNDGLSDFCFNAHWYNMDTTLTNENIKSYGFGISARRDYQVSKKKYQMLNWQHAYETWFYAPRLQEGDEIDSDLEWRNTGCGISIQRSVTGQMWMGSDWSSVNYDGIGHIPIRKGDRYGWFKVQIINSSTLRVLSYSIQN